MISSDFHWFSLDFVEVLSLGSSAMVPRWERRLLEMRTVAVEEEARRRPQALEEDLRPLNGLFKSHLRGFKEAFKRFLRLFGSFLELVLSVLGISKLVSDRPRVARGA